METSMFNNDLYDTDPFVEALDEWLGTPVQTDWTIQIDWTTALFAEDFE